MVKPVYFPLESVARAAPLGLRCVDIATQGQVAGGLLVAAVPRERSARPARAALTRSGVYAIHHLPGLTELEFAGAPPAATSPPASPQGAEFVVTVEDLGARYLSYAMTLTLPRRAPLTTFLFSAPARGGVPGLMSVRGSLKDAARQRPDGSLLPAAFARVEAEYEQTSPPTIYVGLADWRGEFALFMPGPNPLQPPAGVVATSPNMPGRQTIAQLRWPVTLRFFYEPAAQHFITTDERGRVGVVEGQQEGLTDAPPEGARARYFPVLASLLNQSAAEVFEVAGASGGPAAELPAEIEYGKDLVVRTREAADSGVWLVPPPVVSP